MHVKFNTTEYLRIINTTLKKWIQTLHMANASFMQRPALHPTPGDKIVLSTFLSQTYLVLGRNEKLLFTTTEHKKET